MLDNNRSAAVGHIYYYNFSGLNIASEIELIDERQVPAAMFGQAQPDVFIKNGDVPETIENPEFTNSILSVSGDMVHIRFSGLARFMINGAGEVTVYQYPGVTTDRVALCIGSLVQAVLLYKRNYLLMHAAVVKVGDGAVLVVGNSGTGKSTLALGLQGKGYEILTDDIASVYFDAGKPMVHAGTSYLRLMARSLKQYGYKPEQFREIRSGLNKYSFPLQQTGVSPLPVNAMYYLYEWNEPKLECIPIQDMAKFRLIRKGTYKYRLLECLGKKANYFTLSTQLASQTPVYKVSRSWSMCPREFCDFMDQQFKQI